MQGTLYLFKYLFSFFDFVHARSRVKRFMSSSYIYHEIFLFGKQKKKGKQQKKPSEKMIQETIPWVHSLTLYPLWSELFHTRWHCQHFYWFQCLLQPVRGKKNRKINTSKITQFLGIGIHRKNVPINFVLL